MAQNIRKDYEVAIAYADMHQPFEDKTAVRILYEIIADVQPDLIIDLGDNINCDALSRFPKNMSEVESVQHEIELFKRHSRKLNEICPKAKKIYCWDNHFFERLKNGKMAVQWLLSLDDMDGARLLGFDTLGWNLVNEYKWKNRLLFTHDFTGRGNGACPINKARSETQRYGIGVVRAHSHLTGFEVHTQGGRNTLCAQLGTFADKEKADYIFSKDRTNWTASMAQFYLSRKTDEYLVNPILFMDRKTVVNGKLYY